MADQGLLINLCTLARNYIGQHLFSVRQMLHTWTDFQRLQLFHGQYKISQVQGVCHNYTNFPVM